MEKQKLHVVVRIRPERYNDKLWVHKLSDNKLMTFNHRNVDEILEYEFERVFGPTSTQEEVYSHCVRPLLSHVIDGQNASVFAYGPTGSGKTYTIVGEAEQPGIVPRVVEDLFADIDKLKQGEDATQWTYKVSFSYLEIYNEKVQDLLEGKTDCAIREDRNRNIHVEGLSEKVISNVEEFNRIFNPASAKRTTGATLLNAKSSRSHSLLLLKVIKTRRTAEGAVRRQLTGKLYVIDLAGSEDNRRTGNQGIRLKESGAINTSLFMLSEVVEALNKHRAVVPYRQSKLTRLLQDSLGGTAHSCMIVNISPEEQHYLDTVSTLKLARASKKIVNSIAVHEEFIGHVDRRFKRSFDSKNSSTASIDDETKLSKEKGRVAQPVQQPLLSYSPLVQQQRAFEERLHNDVRLRLTSFQQQILQELKLKDNGTIASVQPSNVDKRVSGVASVTDRLEIASKQVAAMKASMLQAETTVHEDSDELLDSPLVIKRIKRVKDSKVKRSASTACLQEKYDTEDLLDSSLEVKRVRPTRRTTRRSCVQELDGNVKSGRNENAKASVGAIDSSLVFPDQTVSENLEFHERLRIPVNGDLDREHSRGVMNTLNVGTKAQLQKLQTLGSKKAQLIVDFRERYGQFNQFEDLLQVPGFTQRSLQNFLRQNFISTVELH